MRFTSILCLAFCALANPASAQFPSDLGNFLGAVMRQGMVAAAQDKWRRLPQAELTCINEGLISLRTSANALAQQGIGPDVPELTGIRGACRQPATRSASIYTVDGLALGGRVVIGSDAYRQYSCSPSDQFQGMTWCMRRKAETSPRGAYTSTNTILHASDGTALYINRFLEPAFFNGNEAQDDVNRLSARFGQARIMQRPGNREIANSLLAIWGEAVLEPIGADVRELLTQGKEVRAGLMIDYLGNFTRSAQLNLPVYRLRGGPGYVWLGSWNNEGRGILRFLAVDAAAIDPRDSSPAPVVQQAPAPLASGTMSLPTVPPTQRPAPPQKSFDKNEIKVALDMIATQRPSLVDPDHKRTIDEIELRLAAAGDELDKDQQAALRTDADTASRLFGEAAEFRKTSDVAARQIDAVDRDLQPVTFDDPYVQSIRAALTALRQSINEGHLPSVRTAMVNLGKVYDSNKLATLKLARSKGFDSVESYQRCLADRERLKSSGIARTC